MYYYISILEKHKLNSTTPHTASTGLGSTGLDFTSLGSTGLDFTSLASTGLGSTGLDFTSLGSTG